VKQWVNISDAVEITNNRVKPFKGERRYLATGDLIGDAVNESIVSVDYNNKPSRADLLVEEGNVIVARMQATNKVLLIDEVTEDLIVSTGFLTLQPKKDFDGSYLAHYFRSDLFQKKKDKYCSGATQKAINNGSFAKLQVPSYSLDEQKKISNILDQADALRQKRKQSLQLLYDFLRATFLDMFGLLDEDDDYVLLNKLTEKISVGHVGPTSFAYVEKDNGIPFLRTQNVKRNFIDLNDLAYVTRDFHNKLKKSQIHGGDVLISRVGVNRGMAAVVPYDLGEANCANVVIVGKSDKFNSIFLAAYLNHTYGKSAKFGYSVGSAQGVVNTGIVRKWPIIDVPLALQNKFALVVDQVEQIKQKMQASSAELDNQFNALTQRYFG
jgi:type I restriction enzyme S subunit